MFVRTCRLYFVSCNIYRTFFFFFFNDTATTEIYTLSLHDALPIFGVNLALLASTCYGVYTVCVKRLVSRSEEHTSELQSHSDLVCRLLLEKKKTNITYEYIAKTGTQLNIEGGDDDEDETY